MLHGCCQMLAEGSDAETASRSGAAADGAVCSKGKMDNGRTQHGSAGC